jgi:hypothetical protein
MACARDGVIVLSITFDHAYNHAANNNNKNAVAAALHFHMPTLIRSSLSFNNWLSSAEISRSMLKYYFRCL